MILASRRQGETSEFSCPREAVIDATLMLRSVGRELNNALATVSRVRRLMT